MYVASEKPSLGESIKFYTFPLLFFTDLWLDKITWESAHTRLPGRRRSKPWRERGPAATQAYTRDLRPLLKIIEFALSRLTHNVYRYCCKK